MTSPFFPIDASRMVHQARGCLAFYDAYPVSPGHTLVIPEEVVVSIFDLSEGRQAELWTVVAEVREILLQRHHPQSFNIGLNDGPAAGQTIPHAHIHIIPRYQGDQTDPRGGVRRIFPDKARYWKESP
ncbi:MAG TPA: HIT family protein [Kiritimatiellia bacterium]|nr:HIT family protein [Kiritimatiellia bacterium]